MKTLKKLLLTVFAFSTAALCTTALAACGEHEHNWGEWTVTTPATCTEAGLEERVCQDDPTHTEPHAIDATGHDWGEWEVTTPATCTTKAVETRVCGNDETHTETRKVGDPLDHDWGAWTVTSAATCTTKAVETRVCGNNKAHRETREVGDPLNHDWGEWEVTTPATCTTKAVETRVCANDETHTEEREVGEPLGHKWVQTANTATCTAAGEKTLTCMRNGCGETKTEASEALNHNWGDWKVTTPTTCTTKAVETRVCSNGSTHKETREVGVPLDHSWGEWMVTTPSTCLTAGVETRICGNDKTHTETRDTDPLDHDWGEWTVTTPSTCLTAGVETRVCGNDNTHKETKTAALADHAWDDGEVTTEPEEYTPGVKTFTCTVDGCGETKTEPIPELGHTHDFDVDWSTDGENHWKECAGASCTEKDQSAAHDWNVEVTTPASCTEAGVKTYTCTVCEKTKTEDIEPSHVLAKTEATDPTCTANGNIDYWTCSECDKLFSDEDGENEITAAQTVIRTPGHVWNGGEVTTPANCTQNGVKTFICEVCDASKTEKIMAYGHSYQYNLVTAPGFTTNGTAVRTCSECDLDEEVNLLSINMMGSSYSYVETTPATCEEEGARTYTIPLLGGSVTFDIVVPATAHKNLKKVAANSETKNITTNANEVKEFSNKDKDYYRCSDCGKMFNDANRTYEVTTALFFGRFGTLIGIGENKIHKNYGNGSVFFQAQADALYTFKFANAVDSTGNAVNYTVTSMNYLINEANPPAVYASKAWKTTVTAYEKFENTTQTPTDTVAVNMKRGEGITITNTTPTWFTVTVESDINIIDFGVNEIEITEANATHSTSNDSYVFVPSETKTYSITVPAGITVLMDGNDIVSANEASAFANFEATKYEAVTFTFIGNAVGKHKVTIGGEIGYTLNLDNEVSFNIVVGKVIGVRIGNIPEGTYKINITGGMLIAKVQGWGSMFMSLNGESDFETVTTNGLLLEANKENQNENLSSNSMSNPWIITATLQAGDMLYFTSNPAWKIPDGNELGDIVITLEAVE